MLLLLLLFLRPSAWIERSLVAAKKSSSMCNLCDIFKILENSQHYEVLNLCIQVSARVGLKSIGRERLCVVKHLRNNVSIIGPEIMLHKGKKRPVVNVLYIGYKCDWPTKLTGLDLIYYITCTHTPMIMTESALSFKWAFKLEENLTMKLECGCVRWASKTVCVDVQLIVHAYIRTYI